MTAAARAACVEDLGDRPRPSGRRADRGPTARRSRPRRRCRRRRWCRRPRPAATRPRRCGPSPTQVAPSPPRVTTTAVGPEREQVGGRVGEVEVRVEAGQVLVRGLHQVGGRRHPLDPGHQVGPGAGDRRPGVDVVADRRARSQRRSPARGPGRRRARGPRRASRRARTPAHPASTGADPPLEVEDVRRRAVRPDRRGRGRGPRQHVRVAREPHAGAVEVRRRAPGRARRRPRPSRTAPAGPAAPAPRRRWRRCRRRTPASTRRRRARCRSGTHPPPARRVPWDVSTMRTWRSTRSTRTRRSRPSSSCAPRSPPGRRPATCPRAPGCRRCARWPPSSGLAANTVAQGLPGARDRRRGRPPRAAAGTTISRRGRARPTPHDAAAAYVATARRLGLTLPEAVRLVEQSW